MIVLNVTDSILFEFDSTRLSTAEFDHPYLCFRVLLCCLWNMTLDIGPKQVSLVWPKSYFFCRYGRTVSILDIPNSFLMIASAFTLWKYVWLKNSGWEITFFRNRNTNNLSLYLIKLDFSYQYTNENVKIQPVNLGKN